MAIGGVSTKDNTGSHEPARETRIPSFEGASNGNTSVVAARRVGGDPTIATVEHAAPRAVVATEALYRRHSQRVWRYCLRSLRRPADAEDAVQQTFLQAHRALQRGVEPVCEAGWLLAIARNICLTRVDASRRRDRTEVNQDVLLLDEVAWAEDADDAISAEVQAAFAELPERQRQALFLREWQGCSYAEIAEALGTSESAVETLLFRARRTLERTLEEPRRSAGDAAGLLGWMRLGLGSAASKVAVAVVTATAAGTGVVAERHSHAVSAHPAAALVAAGHARPPVLRSRAFQLRVRQARHAKPPTRAISPVASAHAAPAPTLQRSEPLAQAPEASAPAPAAEPASAPAAATVDETASATTATTAATTTASIVTTVTATTSSVVDSAAQTVSTAAPPATPVVNAAAQTVGGAVQTVANAAGSVEATETGLLGS